MVNKVIRWLSLLCPALALCLVWQYCAGRSSRAAFLFGSPSLVFKYLIHYFFSGSALVDITVTSAEAFTGFIVGNAVGTILGVGLAFFPRIQVVAKPYVIMLGSIPIFALAPLMIIWFGIGFFAKFMMAFFSTFLIATVHAYNGATQANPDLVQLLMTFNASRFQIFRKVVIPSAVEWVVLSFRITIGFALLGAFIGEFISAERGLGYRILKAGALYNIPGVLSGVLLIALLALVFDKFVDAIARVLLPWRQTTESLVRS